MLRLRWRGQCLRTSGCKAHSLIATSNCPLLVLEPGFCPLYSHGAAVGLILRCHSDVFTLRSLWGSIGAQQQNVTSSYTVILSVSNCFHLPSGSTLRCSLLLLFYSFFFFSQGKGLGGSKQDMHFNALKLSLSPVLRRAKWFVWEEHKIDSRGKMWIKWIITMVPGK